MSAEQKEDKLDPESTVDAKLNKENNTQPGAEAAKARDGASRSKSAAVAGKARPLRRDASADPYIRTLFVIAAAVIIGGLLTVIFAYFSGVIHVGHEGATNIDEFTIAASQAYVDAERTAGALSQLAIAQIGNGQLMEAEVTIQEAFALGSPDEERNQGPMFAHAMLAEAQGNRELAIERYEEVMFQLREDFDHVFNSDMEPNWAQAFGMHPNYYSAAFALASFYEDAGEYDRQVEMLDIAIEGNPTDGDLLFFRGQAKTSLDDTDGAKEDFAAALRFLPDDEAIQNALLDLGGELPDRTMGMTEEQVGGE